jgi:quinol monooxygenase YgiN
MKTFSLPLTILVILVILMTSSQNKQQDAKSKDNYQNFIVVVQYKTQPSKSKEAIEGLMKLIDEVKKEPHFVKIIMHVDPKDETNILLYEEWEEETYYNGDHMLTKHLQGFMEDSRAFLAGPPEISSWRIEKEF